MPSRSIAQEKVGTNARNKQPPIVTLPTHAHGYATGPLGNQPFSLCGTG